MIGILVLLLVIFLNKRITRAPNLSADPKRLEDVVTKIVVDKIKEGGPEPPVNDLLEDPRRLVDRPVLCKNLVCYFDGAKRAS
jgi:hypothetical protein